MNAMNRIYKKRILLDEFLKIFEYCKNHYDFTESNWGMLDDCDPFWLKIIDNYRKYNACECCKKNADKNSDVQETTIVIVSDFTLFLCRDCYGKLKSAKKIFKSEEEVFEYIRDKIDIENKLLQKGDILNPVGIFRSAMINDGLLEKEYYISLVKRNCPIDSLMQLSPEIYSKIEDVWNQAYHQFSKIGLVLDFSDERIRISDPMHTFFEIENSR